MSAHYGRPYHDPHPDTYLAFIAHGVHFLCEAPERSVLNDPNRVLLVETYNRQLVAKFFPDATPVQIEYLVGSETEKARLRIANAEMRKFIRGLAAPALPRGAKRREVPPHQPLRPHTQIIAGTLMRLRSQSPEVSRNKLWNNAARLLNDGLPTRDQSEALAVRSIRSAEEAFRKIDLPTVMQAEKRRLQFGGTHDWDRRFVDFGRAVMGDDDDLAAWRLIEREVIDVLDAIHSIYLAARTDPRFKGLSGEKLADRVDQLEGFERTVNKLIVRPLFGEFGLPESAFIATPAA